MVHLFFVQIIGITNNNISNTVELFLTLQLHSNPIYKKYYFEIPSFKTLIFLYFFL